MYHIIASTHWIFTVYQILGQIIFMLTHENIILNIAIWNRVLLLSKFHKWGNKGRSNLSKLIRLIIEIGLESKQTNSGTYSFS